MRARGKRGEELRHDRCGLRAGLLWNAHVGGLSLACGTGALSVCSRVLSRYSCEVVTSRLMHIVS